MNYTTVDQTVAQTAHEILETSPEHGHGIPDKMGDKMGWGKSQEGGHSIPDQVDKLRDKAGDKRKTKPNNRTRHQTRWETSGERSSSLIKATQVSSRLRQQTF